MKRKNAQLKCQLSTGKEFKTTEGGKVSKKKKLNCTLKADQDLNTTGKKTVQVQQIPK
jgi:hypothetical protein